MRIIEFPTLHIFGGSMPDELERHLFGIEVNCFPISNGTAPADKNDDVTGLTGGLRVMLQANDTVDIQPDIVWENENSGDPGNSAARPFRRPLLLRARGDAAPHDAFVTLRNGIEGPDSVPGGQDSLVRIAAGKSETTLSFEVVVAPILDNDDDWPNQPAANLKLPPLRLVAGAIPIWIDTTSPLATFLQLAVQSATTTRVLGCLDVELSAPPAGSIPASPRGLAASLTTDGIEFYARIPALPARPSFPGVSAPRCLLRLRWNEDKNERDKVPYLLDLVAVGDGIGDPAAIAAYQHRLAAFLKDLTDSQAPLFLDYNDHLTLPPLSWPLEFVRDNLQRPSAIRLIATRTGSVWTAWQARVALEAVRSQIQTSLTAGAAQSVAEMTASRFEIGLRGGTFYSAINGGQTRNGGINVTSVWVRPPGQPGQPLGAWTSQGASLPPATTIEVAVPVRGLKYRLLPLYLEGGSLPAGAQEPAFAFVPLKQGWLQTPLVAGEGYTLYHSATKGVEPRQGFSGIYYMPLDAPSAGPPGGAGPAANRRTVSVSNAALLTVEADWNIAGAAVAIKVTAWDARGRIEGLLYVAETSPTPEEGVPNLAGGPAATSTLPLLFGDRESTLDWIGDFSTTGPIHRLDLQPLDPVAPHRSWIPPRLGMPFITVMPLTRTVASARVPSHSRGLAPATTTRGVTLRWLSPQEQMPELDTQNWVWDTRWTVDTAVPGPAAGAHDSPPADAFAAIGLTLPALPGVQFQPGLPARPGVPAQPGGSFPPAGLPVRTTLYAALRFDLAILDELFARTSRPQAKPPAAAAAAAPGSAGAAASPLSPAGVLALAALPPVEPPRPTALQPDDLADHWSALLEQLQLSATDVAVATPWIQFGVSQQLSIAGLVEPFRWAAGFGTRVAPNGMALPIGGMALAGQHLTANQALRGQCEDVTLQGGPVDVDKVRVRGFGASLFASGGLQWDSRGFALAAEPALRPAAAIRRAAHRDTAVHPFSLVTALQPFRFAATFADGSPGAAVHFWFCNLPCEAVGGKLVFDGDNRPYENGGGFSGQAFEPSKLPYSNYEWRLYPRDAARYDIPLGPFALQPLTLGKVTLSADGVLESFVVVGSLNINRDDPAGGALGPDKPLDHDNLVELTVTANGDYALGPYKNQELQFDLDIETVTANSAAPGPDPAGATVAGRLVLAFTSTGRMGNTLFRACLVCRLFGKTWNLVQQTTPDVQTTLDELTGTRLKVTFGPPPGPRQAFDVGPMDLTIRSDPASGSWQASLGVPLRLTLPVDLFDADAETSASRASAPAFRWEDDRNRPNCVVCKYGVATWLDLPLPDVKVDIDHAGGRVRLPIRTQAPASADLFEGFEVGGLPVVGLLEMQPFKAEPPTLPAGATWPRTAEPAALWMEIDAGPTGSPENEFHVRHVMASRPLAQLLQPVPPVADDDDDRDTNHADATTTDAAIRPAYALLTVTRTIEGTSGISWPLDVAITTLPPGQDPNHKDGRATRIEFGDLGTTYTDKVNLRIVDHELPLALLTRDVSSEDARVLLRDTWRCLATVRHTLAKTGAGTPLTGTPLAATPLTWTAVEYIAIASIETMKKEALLMLDEQASGNAASRETPLALTARFRKKRYRGEDSTRFMRHTGLATTARAASGFTDPHLLRRLAADTEAVPGQLVIRGGAVTLFDWPAAGRAWATTTAFVLADQPLAPVAAAALPAPPANGPAAAAPESVLSTIQQAVGGVWKVSDFDFSPMSLEQDRARPAVLLLGASETAIATTATEALTTAAGILEPSAVPVQQCFFTPLNAAGAPTMPAPDTQVPYFLGTLLTLKAALGLWIQGPPEVQTIVAATLHGATTRLRVDEFQRAATALATPPVQRPTRMVVLGHDGTIAISEVLPVMNSAPINRLTADGVVLPAEAPAAAGAGAGVALPASYTPISYFMGIASVLVQFPRSILLTAFGPAPDFPQSIDVPLPFDDLGLPRDPNPAPRLRRGVSPALGWPTPEGIEEAAALALSFREGDAFSDEGSGFAGRSERFGIPAYSPAPTKETLLGLYMRLGTHVEFRRQQGATRLGPMARHLAPSRIRHRTPTSESVRQVLALVTLDKTTDDVSPIVPPEVQRGDFGSRPGVFQVYGTGMVVATDLAPFDKANARFGRPATGGPPVLHQLRAPRSPALPDDPAPDLHLRRRTYLSLIDTTVGVQGGVQVEKFHLFRVFDDAVAVMRFQQEDRIYARFVFRAVPPLNFGPAWDQQLDLVMDCQTVPPLDPAALAAFLTEAGLLDPAPLPPPPLPPTRLPVFSLAIGTQSFVLTATYDAPRFRLAVTNQFAAVRSALAAATADTPINLVMTIKPGATSTPMPLPVGPPRILTIPLLLDPGDRPTLKVQRQTLAFGDPSYDRQLGSETAASVQRTAGNPPVLPMPKPILLALDRQKYDITSTVYFATGQYDESLNRMESSDRTFTISFQIQPATLPGETPKPARVLKVANSPFTNPVRFEYSYQLQLPPAVPVVEKVPVFAVPMSEFVETSTGAPVNWQDGDFLWVNVVEGANAALQVAARFVATPVVPPSPSVFSLLRSFENGQVDVPLHATAPLATIIEFPDLLRDLGSGYVRRNGLFIWTWAESTAFTGPQSAYLVKVDRSGGAQLPLADADFTRSEAT